MKRIIILLLVVLMLAACQPTPETEFVVNKGDQSAMIDMAKGEDVDTVTADSMEGQSSTESNTREIYGIPERLTMTSESPDGRILLAIDAPILAPDAPMPMVRVFAAEFDQDTVTRFWNALIGDTVMYPEDANYVPTKRDIADSMQALVDMLDGKTDWRDRYNSEDAVRAELDRLQAQYADAPDDGPKPTAPDGRLIEETLQLPGASKSAKRTALDAVNYIEGKRFTVRNDSDNTEAIIADGADGWNVISIDKQARMEYTQYSSSMGCGSVGSGIIHVSRTDPLPEAAAALFRTTPKKAAEAAETFLSSVGLSGAFAVSQIALVDDRDPQNGRQEPTRYAYWIWCVRTVKGVPCATTRGVYASGENLYAKTYTPRWDYEALKLMLDDSGIYCVSWNAPLHITDTLHDACTLLPFERIEDVFRTRLCTTLPSCTFDAEDSLSVSVDRIELGLWRILEQHELGRGLLVPAYCLYGTCTRMRDGWDAPQEEEYSLLYVVNAIDGSIIDPTKGY